MILGVISSFTKIFTNNCWGLYHARIYEFSSGGGGGRGVHSHLTSVYFTEGVQGVQWVNLRKKIPSTQACGGRPTFSSGGRGPIV